MNTITLIKKIHLKTHNILLKTYRLKRKGEKRLHTNGCICINQLKKKRTKQRACKMLTVKMNKCKLMFETKFKKRRINQTKMG